MTLENRRFRLVAVLMFFLFLIGVVTWFYFLGTSKILPWGAFIANFIYFLGVTQGALVIAVVLRASSAKWGPPFYRLSGAMTLAFFPIALVMLITIIASKGVIFYWVKEVHHPWFISSFFISRNLITFFLFYGLALALFNTSLAKNLGAGRKLIHRLLIMGLFLLLVFVLHQTVISWDLGMTLDHDWASTVYSPFFWVGSIYAGAASLVVIMAFLKRFFGVDSFPADSFVNLGHLLLALSVLWFYHWWSQFFPIWYGNMPEETEALYLRIFTSYGSIYGWMMFLSSVIPFLALLFMRVRRSVTLLSGVSTFILIGIWLDRYLLVVPSLVKEHKSIFTPVFGFANLSITLGILGGFLLLFFLLLRRYPRILASKEVEPKDVLLSEPQGW